MLSIAKGLAGFTVAAVLSSPVGAQGIVLQKNITLALAQTIANAAISAMPKHGIQSLGNDRRSRGAADCHAARRWRWIAYARGKRPQSLHGTRLRPAFGGLRQRLQDRPETVGSRHYSRVLALDGGLPIKVGDEIVGAVGVSGTPGKDDDCAQAGIDKVADQLK